MYFVLSLVKHSEGMVKRPVQSVWEKSLKSRIIILRILSVNVFYITHEQLLSCLYAGVCFFFLFYLVSSSYLWKRCSHSNEVVRNVGEWLISGTVEQGVLGFITAFFFWKQNYENRISKKNCRSI